MINWLWNFNNYVGIEIQNLSKSRWDNSLEISPNKAIINILGGCNKIFKNNEILIKRDKISVYKERFFKICEFIAWILNKNSKRIFTRIFHWGRAAIAGFNF